MYTELCIDSTVVTHLLGVRLECGNKLHCGSEGLCVHSSANPGLRSSSKISTDWDLGCRLVPASAPIPRWFVVADARRRLRSLVCLPTCLSLPRARNLSLSSSLTLSPPLLDQPTERWTSSSCYSSGPSIMLMTFSSHLIPSLPPPLLQLTSTDAASNCFLDHATGRPLFIFHFVRENVRDG